jgi:hypothetical protein
MKTPGLDLRDVDRMVKQMSRWGCIFCSSSHSGLNYAAVLLACFTLMTHVMISGVPSHMRCRQRDPLGTGTAPALLYLCCILLSDSLGNCFRVATASIDP